MYLFEMSNFFPKLAELVIKRRIFFILIGFVIAFVLMTGAPNIKFDTDARVFFDENNPDRIALENFEGEYSKDDNLAFVISPKNGDIFTPKNLNAIGILTEKAWLLPYVRTVYSLTNYQNSYADGDSLIVEDLITDIENISEEDANYAEEVANSRIELKNAFINSDNSISQVNILFRLPGKDAIIEIPYVMNEVEILKKEFESQFPEIELRMVGFVPLNNQYSVSGQDDSAKLTPMMILVTLIAVAIILRTIFGVGLIFIIIVLCAGSSVGALGWSGTNINNATVVAPLMVMTLAVASAVHILSSVRQTMTITPDRNEWVRRAIVDHGPAITVACLTTAIGFLSLNFSISPPFRQLGNIVFVGVIAALFYTLTMLPALISLLPLKKQNQKAIMDKSMSFLAEFVIRRKNSLLAFTAALIAILVFGISKISLEDDFLRYFGPEYELRQSIDYYEDNFAGLNALEYSVNSGKENGVNDPEYLMKVESLVNFLRSQPNISSVRSYTDVVKRLNQNFNEDDESFYKVPNSELEAAQYLFLYELSLGYGLDLTDQINVDKSALRVTANVSKTTTKGFLELDKKVQSWFDENAPELSTKSTGTSQVFSKISSRDVPAMLKGTGLALIGISFIILLVIRNIKYGLMSLIPNLLPAAMAFGLWGYFTGSVTLAVSIVVAMTLGIVVDDSVHFMLKYAKARKEGKSPEDSVRQAFEKVGMALTTTTIGLFLGFCVLAQSGFAVNKDMAQLTAITVVFALVVDYLLLPPVLIWIDNFKLKRKTT